METGKTWIVDIIETNRRMFQIPVYQRNYDWSYVQCEKLYEDIINVIYTTNNHFIGTIVRVNSRSTTGLNVDLIIDGQQRFTTIFILIKVLLDKAVELDEPVKDELNDLLYNRNCEEAFKLKLKPIKDDNVQFKFLMLNEYDKMKESSNITKNYRLFLKLVNQSLEKGQLVKDILKGIRMLQLIEIILDKNIDDPQIIFESINSTGLELSLADKIRNFILMNDEKQEELFENFWSYIEKLIHPSNMEDFFINFLNYKMSDTINSKNAYDKFKKLFYNEKYTNESMLIELKRCSVYYASFIGNYHFGGEKVTELLKDIREMDQSTAYPFLFSIFNDFENKAIDQKELTRVLEFLRTYCFRRLICEVPSNSLRGLFKTLYNRLFSNNKEEYYKKIYSFFVTIRTRDKLIEENEVAQKLKTIDLYNKRKICKFLLAAIENKNSKETIDMTNLSIEHILPQQKNNLVWKRIIGEDYERIYDTYLHTIGNLTITGYNSELGTRSFEDKVKIIKEHSKAATLNLDIINKTTWSEEYIKERANRLAKIANKVFSYESTKVIDLYDDEKYTLDDIERVPGTKPTSFSIAGEIVPVSSYADMITKTMNLLFNLEPKYLLELANSKFRMSQDGRIYISYNLNDLFRGKEIGNTGIYVEYNMKAKDVLTFLKKVLEIHSFETDDFFFTVRKD